MPIDEAAQAVPCDVEMLRTWLQQGHIQGRDSLGQRDRQITRSSSGIHIDVESLKRYCAKIGVQPSFGRKS